MEKIIKHLGVSGGGTKIHGLFSAAKVVLKEFNYKPDYYSGISAGSILGIPLALGLYDEIEALTSTLNTKTFFSHSPMNKKNKISIWAGVRALLGLIGITKTNSLGHMGNLYKIYKKVVSPERFKRYVEGDFFPVYVGYVDAITGRRIYINLKDVDYETHVKAVVASSSIPVFTKPVIFNGTVGLDGGVRDHIGTSWMLDEFKIDRSVSIYSRPDDLTGYLNPAWKPKNVFDVLMRSMDIMLIEISKSDERIEDEICIRKGIQQKKIFLPKIMDGFYDVNPEKIKRLGEYGKALSKVAMSTPWK